MSTPGDRRILNSVVNPLLPLGEAVYDDEEEEENSKEDVEESPEIRFVAFAPT